MEVLEYGKFGWILDPEGNKIELWEPNDTEFEKWAQIQTHPPDKYLQINSR
jgi:hypothetical protein